MPLTEAQPDAVARVYAKSVYELAEQRGGREHVELVLGQLEDVLEMAREDARFNEFLASRVLPTPKRSATLQAVFAGRADELVVNFLLLINDKERLAHLPAIVAALDELVQERFGRVEVDVFTASPASPDEVATIKQRLSDAMGKDVVVHPYTEPDMLGGVKLKIGDRLLDGSLRTKLATMQQSLFERGAPSVLGRASSMIDDS